MDRSFRSYCRQSPTMRTLMSNRNLWRMNIILAVTTMTIATDWWIY